MNSISHSQRRNDAETNFQLQIGKVVQGFTKSQRIVDEPLPNGLDRPNYLFVDPSLDGLVE